MFSSFRNRFGIPGVISVIALVFAMFGGAYAASNNGGSGKATASAKGKPGPRGPRGKTGPAGPQGPAGPAGPAGAKGDTGSAGSNGSNGSAGKSVVVANTAPGCSEGGITVEVEGSGVESEVCNGEEGEKGETGDPGEPGSPWVVGTAPSGVVMKGTWVLPPATAAAANEEFYAPISTGVPIKQLSPESEPLVVFAGEPPFCTGTAANPKPPFLPATETVIAGAVCVYSAAKTNLVTTGMTANSKLTQSGGGAVATFKSAAAGTVNAYGSWAMGTP